MSSGPYQVFMSNLSNDEQLSLINTFKKENKNWFGRTIEIQNDSNIISFMESLNNWKCIYCDITCINDIVEYVIVVCISRNNKEEVDTTNYQKTVTISDGNEFKIYYHIDEKHEGATFGWNGDY